MAHQVICYYCKQKFDRDKHPFIQVNSRRYAHKECALSEEVQQKNQEEQDKNTLEEYIKKLLNITALGPKINKQIKTFKDEYNYSYIGIYKSLKYFYEVKGNDIKKANGGIGIVPYVYKSANDYYLALWEAQQKNETKIEILQTYIPQVKEIIIKRPQLKPKRKNLFTFLDEEQEGE